MILSNFQFKKVIQKFKNILKKLPRFFKYKFSTHCLNSCLISLNVTHYSDNNSLMHTIVFYFMLMDVYEMFCFHQNSLLEIF